MGRNVLSFPTSLGTVLTLLPIYVIEVHYMRVTFVIVSLHILLRLSFPDSHDVCAFFLRSWENVFSHM